MIERPSERVLLEGAATQIVSAIYYTTRLHYKWGVLHSIPQPTTTYTLHAPNRPQPSE